MANEVWVKAEVLCQDCGYRFRGSAPYFQRQPSASPEPSGWIPADKPASRCENPECRSDNTFVTDPKVYKEDEDLPTE